MGLKMGSEQSSHSRSRTHKSRAGVSTGQAGRSSSPRPSISSDSDIPYISYAVNRPIGDSPKLPSKIQGHGLRTSTPSPRPSPKPPRPHSYAGSTTHEIVVVKEAQKPGKSIDTDEELNKLKNIPHFFPIMRETLNVPSVRDPEVLNKLDHDGVLKLCLRYQDHLRQCTEVVSGEQNSLASRIREIDFAVATLMSMMTERQKKFAKYAEQLGKVHDISSTLKRCHMTLTELVESMDTLNKLLPEEEKLEPFVMVTG
ncbi:BLOC-1 related complex subunit 5 isoform X1 [Tachypleus tridentatus]|uniref:BLOC-1 related complex subunit 5 isoform X1 n=2 Tax=Tachypleus tridentatus TaxID=6853 RepID=UPI003FD4C1BC